MQSEPETILPVFINEKWFCTPSLRIWLAGAIYGVKISSLQGILQCKINSEHRQFGTRRYMIQNGGDDNANDAALYSSQWRWLKEQQYWVSVDKRFGESEISRILAPSALTYILQPGSLFVMVSNAGICREIMLKKYRNMKWEQ